MPRTSVPPARRFGLLDAMILVAATAAGLAATRSLAAGITWGQVAGLFERPSGGWTVEYAHGLAIEVGVLLTVPMALAWTLGLLACGLRGPRPLRRRSAGRPGLMAGLAVVPTLAACAAAALVIWLKGHRFNLDTLVLLPTPPGFSVVGAWTALAIGRRWRAEPTWSDRLGRVLGAYWIVAGLLYPSYHVIWL